MLPLSTTPHQEYRQPQGVNKTSPTEKIEVAIIDDFTNKEGAKLTHGELVTLAGSDKAHQLFGENWKDYIYFKKMDAINHFFYQNPLLGHINYIINPKNGVDD